MHIVGIDIGVGLGHTRLLLKDDASIVDYKGSFWLSLTWEYVCIPVKLLDIRVNVHATIMCLQESDFLQHLILGVDVPCHARRLILRHPDNFLHLVLLVLN